MGEKAGMTILPITYLGGIEWFRWLAAGDCVIDIGENWVKQTARNRCEIMTSGGVTTLVVPVHASAKFLADDNNRAIGNSPDIGIAAGGCTGNSAVSGDGYNTLKTKLLTKDVRIDNSRGWQHQHWVSLVSAYKNSPFFEHYEERFAPIYAKKLNFLTDLNLELLNILTTSLGIENRIQISEDYILTTENDVDLRGKKSLRRLNNLTLCRPDNDGQIKQPGGGGRMGLDSSAEREYTQVFSDRNAFVSGLSVIDLLFCEGPAARDFLATQI